MKRIFSSLEDKWQIILLGMSGFILVLAGILFFVLMQEKATTDTPEADLYTELIGIAEPVEPEVTDDVPEKDNDINEVITSSGEVTVDVKGAVLHPGVYTLVESQRIIDAIEQAGGLQTDAEGTAVNFAQILEDQMVIYVPKIGEEIESQSIVIAGASKSSEAADASDDTIDINKADQTQLMSLNGIGQVKAENIINYRAEHGLFQTIEDLKKVSGIGEVTFNNLKDKIVISK